MSSAGVETTIMTSVGPVPVRYVPFVPRLPFDGLFDPDILDWWRPPAPRAADRVRKRARGAGTSDDDDALARQLREVAAADRSDGSGDEYCAICLHGFRVEETLRAMPACAHAFHHHCICEWLRRNPVCPHCRRRLPAAPTPGDDDEEEVDDDWEDWVDAGISWEVDEEGYDGRRMTRRFRLI